MGEAGTNHVRQIFYASTPVHTFAASDVRMRERFFRPFPEKDLIVLLEQQYVFAEHFDEEAGVGKDGTSKVAGSRP